MTDSLGVGPVVERPVKHQERGVLEDAVPRAHTGGGG